MVLADALLVLAQNSQGAPDDDGVGAGLIILGIAIAVLVFAGIAFVFARSTRASRGGVQPAPGERRPGDPPFEGVERDR
jgi:hypothetical protein